MARGDGGKFLFLEREDSLLFLQWLSQVCESHGWRVHCMDSHGQSLSSLAGDSGSEPVILE